MFRRIFAAALGAGIGVGVLIAALQHVALVPMILEAEHYEKRSTAPRHEHGSLLPQASAGAAALLFEAAQAHGGHDGVPTVAEDSPWRPLLTFIATTLISVGFALLLVGSYAVSGRQVDAREGLLWGIAGFAAFALAPAFGLPPELPGSAVADLFARQTWWIATAAAAAAALGLMSFVRASWSIPLGVALLIAPHLIGAPQPADGAGLVPPELAAAFAARSLGINAVLWALLGLATGALYARFGRAARA